jgi:hypothetical protein
MKDWINNFGVMAMNTVAMAMNTVATMTMTMNTVAMNNFASKV